MNIITKHYLHKTFFVAWSVFFAIFGASCIITGYDSVNEYSNFFNYFFQSDSFDIIVMYVGDPLAHVIATHYILP
jgi:hypothetical protein